MRNRRLLYVLGGVFVMMVVLVALQNSDIPARFMTPPTPTPQPIEAFPTLFENITAEDIQAIRLRGMAEGESLLLRRDETGTWTAPDIEGEPDTEQVELIAETIAIIPYAQTIPITAETELAEFGFTEDNPAALSIEIMLRGGESHAMFVGDAVPGGVAHYALINEGQEIYLIEPRAVAFLRVQLRNPPIRLTSD